MRKIYIATSWVNSEIATSFATELRMLGHKVFLFCDSENRPNGFDRYVFNGNDWKGKNLKEMEYKEFLKYPETKRACASDKAGLDWADTVILFLPSGRSSHLEAGYAKGSGKEVFIVGDLPLGEFDAMYLLLDGAFHRNELSQLYERLLCFPAKHRRSEKK